MRRATSLVFAAITTAATAVGLSSDPAAAKGCGGYVNVAVWGCAPWDNNPPKAGVTPGFKPQPAKPAPVATRQPVVTPPKSGFAPNAGGKLITDNGAGVIARDGAGLVGTDAASLQKQRLIGNDGGSLQKQKLVGHDGSTFRR